MAVSMIALFGIPTCKNYLSEIEALELSGRHFASKMLCNGVGVHTGSQAVRVSCAQPATNRN
jgi:hypothetical protein